ISQMYVSGDSDAADWAQEQVKLVTDSIQQTQDAINQALGEVDDDGWFGNIMESLANGFADFIDFMDPAVFGADSLVVDFLRDKSEEQMQAILEAMQITPEDEIAINQALQQLFQLASNPN